MTLAVGLGHDSVSVPSFDQECLNRYPNAAFVERWPSGRRRSPAKGV